MLKCLHQLAFVFHLVLGESGGSVSELAEKMRRAYGPDATTLDYADAVLALEGLEKGLRAQGQPTHLLDWVDLNTSDLGGLYRQLQRLKKEYGA